MKALAEKAPAKVNLSLEILGRYANGYHALDSIVVFADVGDRLALKPGATLSLTVRGVTAEQAGPLDDNLVLKAARGLAAAIPSLKSGRFTLDKRLPVAAGLGGGSSDAAAALRLLARVNRIVLGDRRLLKVARDAGADVPVCVDPRPRRMRGVGERLSPPLRMPALPAVLVNPRVAVPTGDVFGILGLKPGGPMRRAAPARALPRTVAGVADYVAGRRNDLEPPAIRIQPVIARVLDDLRAQDGCLLARMSGSGATCFGLFSTPREAKAAARKLAAAQPRWWVTPTLLG